MIVMTQYIDVIVPRGGKSLIARLMAEARVPMIKHLDGICHTYIDADADVAMAIKVCDNAKTQRYAPCNAMETLLVNKAIAPQVLPALCKIYQDKGVELRVDSLTRQTLESAGFQNLVEATEEDWQTEYLAPILSIKTVADIDEAMNHIELKRIASYGRWTVQASWLMRAPVLRMVLNTVLVQKLVYLTTNYMHVDQSV
jgi:glutamate-5-semialdehyde dehydrogenase